MLIHLAGDLGGHIEHELNTSTSVVQAVQNIAQARWQGDHLITGDDGVLRQLTVHPALSESTHGVFQRIREEQSQVGGLRSILKARVEVTSFTGNIVTSDNGDARIIFVPLARFERNDITQPTFLVAENLVDCELLLRFSRWFSMTYLQGRFPTRLSSTFMPGGGDTTDRVLEYLSLERRHLGICFTDSDVLRPGGSLGQTAKKCVALDLTPLCVHLTLECRAMENLLCVEQIRAVLAAERERHDLVPRLERLAHLSGTTAWLHLSLKSGARETVGPPRSGSELEFWRSVSASPAPANDGYIFPSISAKLSAWVSDHLKTKEPVRLESDTQLLEIWRRIAQVVVSWTCGSQPMRA